MWNNVIMFAWIFLIYLSLMMLLDMSSINKWKFTNAYITHTHAKLNFYQDRYGTHNYSLSGSSFWSSPQYYNASYDTVRVIHGSEPTDLPVSISNIVTRITRDSH